MTTKRSSIDQTQKGICHPEHGLMFHFKHEFSKKWIDASDEKIIEAMLTIIETLGYSIETYQLKKWRYADPFTTFGSLAYSPENYPGLHLGGDAFGGGSVEGAWRSAMELYKRLKS